MTEKVIISVVMFLLLAAITYAYADSCSGGFNTTETCIVKTPDNMIYRLMSAANLIQNPAEQPTQELLIDAAILIQDMQYQCNHRYIPVTF